LVFIPGFEIVGPKAQQARKILILYRGAWPKMLQAQSRSILVKGLGSLTITLCNIRHQNDGYLLSIKALQSVFDNQ
jgi:hypothetical protein